MAVSKMAKTNSLPKHRRLVGKAANKANQLHQEVLGEFFERLLLLAQPRAMVQVRDVVRDVVRTELRNEGSQVDVPTHMTKRGVYAKLVEQQGWVYRYDFKGRCISEDAVEGVEQKPVPSWGTTRNY
jgi:hypothetical protein